MNAFLLSFMIAMILISSIPVPKVTAQSTSEIQTGFGLGAPHVASFQTKFKLQVHQGDLLVAMVSSHSTTNVVVTDGQQNSWNFGYQDNHNALVQIWWTVARSTSTSDTVTFALSPTISSYVYGFLVEFNVGGFGADCNKLFFCNWSLGSTYSCPSVDSFTPNQGDAVVDVAFASNGGWSPSGPPPTGPYSMVGPNTGWDGAAEWAQNWGSGSTSASWNAPCGASYDEVAMSFSPGGNWMTGGTYSIAGNTANYLNSNTPGGVGAANAVSIWQGGDASQGYFVQEVMTSYSGAGWWPQFYAFYNGQKIDQYLPVYQQSSGCGDRFAQKFTAIDTILVVALGLTGGTCQNWYYSYIFAGYPYGSSFSTSYALLESNDWRCSDFSKGWAVQFTDGVYGTGGPPPSFFANAQYTNNYDYNAEGCWTTSLGLGTVTVTSSG